jgi:hypothetical protein
MSKLVFNKTAKVGTAEEHMPNNPAWDASNISGVEMTHC